MSSMWEEGEYLSAMTTRGKIIHEHLLNCSNFIESDTMPTDDDE